MSLCPQPVNITRASQCFLGLNETGCPVRAGAVSVSSDMWQATRAGVGCLCSPREFSSDKTQQLRLWQDSLSERLAFLEQNALAYFFMAVLLLLLPDIDFSDTCGEDLVEVLEGKLT